MSNDYSGEKAIGLLMLVLGSIVFFGACAMAMPKERFTWGVDHWHCTVNENSTYLKKSYADCVKGDKTLQLVMDFSKENPKWERVVPVSTR